MIWLDGRLVAPDEARIDPADRGFLLGDGLFETLLAVEGKPILLQEHLSRLSASAKEIDLPLPIDVPAIAGATHDVIAANQAMGKSQAIRITLSRGIGARGLVPPWEPSPTLLISAAEYRPTIAASGASAKVVPAYRRNEGSPLSRMKTLNYLDGVLAAAAAAREGFDEAILLNNAGALVCASRANLFVLKGDILATPPISDGALPGIARKFAIEVAGALGQRVVEARLTQQELEEAQEAFLTNSLIGAAALRRIDGISMDEGPICRAVQAAYRDLSG